VPPNNKREQNRRFMIDEKNEVEVFWVVTSCGAVVE
jgi:hypothetical protein